MTQPGEQVGNVASAVTADQTPISQSDAIAIYGVYVAAISETEQRRDHTSNVFVSLFAAGLAAVAAIKITDFLFPAIAALILSWFWMAKLSNFRDLSAAKWKAALEIEQRFALRPFTREYEFLKEARRKAGRKHVRLVELESRLPIALFWGSGIYLLYRLAVVLVPEEWQVWSVLF